MLQKAIFDSTEIYKLLTQLGADLHYIGFRYTEYALLLMGEDEQCIHSVTKCLYPEIARRYQTSCHAVERNIRTLSQVAWKSEPGLLQKMAGHSLEKRHPVSFLQSYFHILRIWILLPAVNPSYKESMTYVKISGARSKNGSGYFYAMVPAVNKTRQINSLTF